MCWIIFDLLGGPSRPKTIHSKAFHDPHGRNTLSERQILSHPAAFLNRWFYGKQQKTERSTPTGYSGIPHIHGAMASFGEIPANNAICQNANLAFPKRGRLGRVWNRRSRRPPPFIFVQSRQGGTISVVGASTPFGQRLFTRHTSGGVPGS